MNWTEDTQDKGDHLNVYGAEKVTSYLGNYLEENYELEDHRNDPTYEAWNQLAEQYKQNLARDTRRNRSGKRNGCGKMIAKERVEYFVEPGADSGKVCRPGCCFGCESGADLERNL